VAAEGEMHTGWRCCGYDVTGARRRLDRDDARDAGGWPPGGAATRFCGGGGGAGRWLCSGRARAGGIVGRTQEPGAAGGLAWRRGEKEQGLGAWWRRTRGTLGNGVQGGFIWAQG
jgi:hypothetical protein